MRGHWKEFFNYIRRGEEMEITLYKRNKVSFKFVQYGLALPFFRLEVPNISFCYNNPLKCIKEALNELERHEIENSNEI